MPFPGDRRISCPTDITFAPPLPLVIIVTAPVARRERIKGGRAVPLAVVPRASETRASACTTWTGRSTSARASFGGGSLGQGDVAAPSPTEFLRWVVGTLNTP